MLEEYLSTSTCDLNALHLSGADVDDTECATFCKCLHKNTSLEELDLSHNLIGTEETRNAVNPDFYTGGEAIADMVRAYIAYAFISAHISLLLSAFIIMSENFVLSATHESLCHHTTS